MTLTRETFVRVRDFIPDILVDLPYSTPHNFTGRQLYEFSDAWLRYGTVCKLAQAQRTLQQSGYSLKIWDAFRPVATQFVMWEVYPDDTYVANPMRGFSWHSRGNTVDVTLVDTEGRELLMPTPFDNFFYQLDCSFTEEESATAAANCKLLRDTMISAGFRPYEDEWWHFYDLDEYEVEKDFYPEK